MDRMLYVAMTGASESMVAHAIEANNLANISTVGFKKDVPQSRSMPVFGDYLPSRAYSKIESPGHDMSNGPLMTTGNDLDLAINGEGWIVVEDEFGKESFTRDGRMKIDTFGNVTTQDGFPVMGNAGPLIIPEYETLEIGEDGTISIRPLGQGAEALVEVDRMKLVNPANEDLVRSLDGRYRRKDGELELPDFGVRVIKGALEGANVNAVESMVNIITKSREYEMHVKMMKTSGEMDKSENELLRIS